MAISTLQAITILIEALHSAKESESISLSSGIPISNSCNYFNCNFF